MSIYRWTLISVTCFLILPVAPTAVAYEPDPLFQSDEILEVRIEAALRTLTRERPLEDELAAILQYVDTAGNVIKLDIQVRTRGRYRRRADICKFPPVRLNFKKSQVADTLFDKQDKVKLVTHCNASSRYTQAVLRERLTYRILNELTDTSYRVRLLKITYVDTDKKSREDVRYGFIIEHHGRLAKRIEQDVLQISNTKARKLRPAYSNLTSVFQYMIGNTDFSQIEGAAGEPCCHNHVLFQAEGNSIYSIPYDFDQAGLVGAPHAEPNPKFRLRSVQQRLYRGRCINNEHLAATIEHFHSKQEAIMSLISEDPGISKSTRKTMTSYLSKFYKTISAEKSINSALIKSCI